jgi:translation initiation factor 5
MFYDADILEEKVLLEWAGKVSKKYVSREMSQEIHAKAEPFIKWLKEAEEEDDTDSEDEDDDDDDLEVSYMRFVNFWWLVVQNLHFAHCGTLK